MRIVYFTEWDAYSSSGVLSKIEYQVNVWKSLGHEVHVLLTSIPPLQKGLVPLINAQTVYCKALSYLPSGFIQTYTNKVLSINRVKKEIWKISPDLIYTRQSIWYPGLTSLYRKYPTVVELNTDDVSELRLTGGFKNNIYLLGREKIIKSARGFLAVSHEIGRLYAKYNKPIEVVANGFDLSRVAEQQTVYNERPQLLFVGSPDQVWHGIDKILVMARLIPEYDLHMVGPILNSERLPSNLIQHGYLNKNELYDLYKKINIGIGSLALHRKQMNEASPLKVREYAAFGLPMILGYQDTDLQGQDFILYIGNYENNVLDRINEIKAFVDLWKNIKVSRTDVEALISSRIKETKRLNFFQKLL
jgi:hypothetical protein